MHYVTHRSHQMRKHKFGITCPEALFLKSVPAPPDLEKYCVDDSLSERTEMHYVTRGSHRMQKQKFGVMCPDALIVKSVLVPPEHEKLCQLFMPRTHRNALCDPQIPPDAKNTSLA
jgi:hypothetical protein